MMTKNDFIIIANTIITTDWNNSKGNIKKDNFNISQFPGTIFPSDYQCFKVEYKGNIFVAKITSSLEYDALKFFKQDGFSVPNPIGCVYIKNCSKICLFENFLPGSELNSKSSQKMWQNAAVELAKMHLKYWGNYEKESIFRQGTKQYESKLAKITNNYSNSNWSDIIKLIHNRFKEIPYTVEHGDAFPTNFLVHKLKVSMIDLANVGIMPYIVDIARLTCLPNLNGTLLCPYKESIQDTYYNEIKSQTNLTKERFLSDVKLASFIELIANYVPPIGLNFYSCSYKCKINKITEQMLNNLANDLRHDLH
ncbi:MAG: hypothetical protein LKF81_11880 [Prevotella sp.]|jgi:aminoglycoside phosphotransferase|nr:hypothetical protein [Prevotella sp.]